MIENHHQGELAIPRHVSAISLAAHQDAYGRWRCTMSSRYYGLGWNQGERRYLDYLTTDELLDGIFGTVEALINLRLVPDD